MKNLDYHKYKRIFTFGCSYTNYGFPTWADVLTCDFKGEYINLGRFGAGNTFIHSRLSQANRVFKFDDNDLVLIMWASFTREDRFIDRTWETYGNVFQTSQFEEDFVRKYANVVHYWLRDFAIIDTAKSWLTTLPCTSYQMHTSNFTDKGEIVLVEKEQEYLIEMLQTRYSNLFEGSPIAYNDFIIDNFTIEERSVQYDDFIDYHPPPNVALEYLKHIGFQPNQKHYDYVEEHSKILRSFKTVKDLHKHYNDWNVYKDRVLNECDFNKRII